MLSIDFDLLKATTAILSLLHTSHGFAEAGRYAISLGGDIDTIGTMTRAIGGTYHGAETISEVEKQIGSLRLHRNVGSEPVED